MTVIKPSTNKRTKAPIISESLDNHPRGILRMEIENQNIICFHVPKEKIGRLKKEVPEVASPGIYFLFKETASRNEEFTVYVGQAHDVIKRLTNHAAKNKAEFEYAMFFISEVPGKLDSSVINYLEREFIKDIFSAKNEGYNLRRVNKEIPGEVIVSNHTTLKEYLGVIKWYIENMNFDYRDKRLNPNNEVIVNTVTEDHVYLFERMGEVSRIEPISNEFIITNAPKFYLNSQAGEKAEGFYNTETGVFYILKGSILRETQPNKIPESVKQTRNYLINNNLIVHRGEGYELLRDIAFLSPSTAANVVLSQNSNGQIMWLTDTKETFKSVFQE